jgi:hypothetical protein
MLLNIFEQNGIPIFKMKANHSSFFVQPVSIKEAD